MNKDSNIASLLYVFKNLPYDTRSFGPNDSNEHFPALINKIIAAYHLAKPETIRTQSAKLTVLYQYYTFYFKEKHGQVILSYRDTTGREMSLILQETTLAHFIARCQLERLTHPDRYSLDEKERKSIVITGSFEGINLKKADLTHVRFVNAKFNRSQFQEADFSQAVLTDCRISNSDLSQMKVEKTQLIGVNISHTELSGTDFGKMAPSFGLTFDQAAFSHQISFNSLLHLYRSDELHHVDVSKAEIIFSQEFDQWRLIAPDAFRFIDSLEDIPRKVTLMKKFLDPVMQGEIDLYALSPHMRSTMLRILRQPHYVENSSIRNLIFMDLSHITPHAPTIDAKARRILLEHYSAYFINETAMVDIEDTETTFPPGKRIGRNVSDRKQSV